MRGGMVLLCLFLAGCAQEVYVPEVIPEEPKVETDPYLEAVESLDASLCENIENEVLREDCVDVIRRLEVGDVRPIVALSDDEKNYGLAVVNNDVASCDSIEDETLRSDCIGTVGRAVHRNVVSKEYSSADADAYTAALLERDPSLCDSIEDVSLREDCLTI